MDLKQPGIYTFFLAAGSLFGFTQIGEHLADLVWQLTFAVALACALPGTLENRRVALFAPIAVVGAYYAGSSSWHLMQVEGLVGLPLFCVAWGAIAATRSDTIRQRLMFEISSADADRIGAGGTELEPICVFGEPLIYVIAGRTQAIAMNGWAPQINTRPLDVRRTRAHATVARLREREFQPLSRHIARRSYLGV